MFGTQVIDFIFILNPIITDLYKKGPSFNHTPLCLASSLRLWSYHSGHSRCGAWLLISITRLFILKIILIFNNQ